MGAIAFDPSDPAKAYAGTGEGNAYSKLGQGLLASDDGGATWKLIGQQLLAGVGFYRLLIDPHDGKHLLAATTGGPISSHDGGTTWSLLRHVKEAWDVSLGYAQGHQEVALACSDGLFTSIDGRAFEPVTLPGAPAVLDPRNERMAVIHPPVDADHMFAFVGAKGRASLWHRAALGMSFEVIELPLIRVGDYLRNSLDVSQAWYDWYVAAPPDSTDVVYLGAIELLKGQRSNGEWRWTDISSRQGTGDSIHPDHHAMAFDPEDASVVYAGSDGGVFRSGDGGEHWESLNDGLAISEVEYLAQRPDDPAWMLAGLQDNGTVRREPGQTWTQVDQGDGGDCGTNMASPDTCFHSFFDMWLMKSTSRGDVGSWGDVSPPVPETGYENLFYPPFEVNGDLVVKAGQTVFMSDDGATSWREVQLPAADGRTSIASALAISGMDRILVGTISGDIFKLDRVSGNWNSAEPLSKPREAWVSDLLIDPNQTTRCWATYSTTPGSVFRSDDSGGSWNDVTGQLPRIPVNAIVSDSLDPDRVWVACDVGVFESRDAGSTWRVFGTGLPNALAEDLLFFAPARLLRVGTRSRGVWEIGAGA